MQFCPPHIMTLVPHSLTSFIMAFLSILVSPQPGIFAQQAGAVENTRSPDKLCTIAGQVVQGANEPLRKARVILTNEDSPSADPYVAITDSEGRFRVTGILPARYDMRVEHSGYISKSYGEDESGNSSSAILLLKAGQQMTDLLFRLQRCGAISGRVVDEDGDPAQGMAVEAVQRLISRGKVSIGGGGQATTNDLGEYRVFGLRPGLYFLRTFPERGNGEIVGKVLLEQSILNSIGGYVPTYYPNVPDITRASPIEVKAGDDITGVDFVLLRTRSYRIRGQISNTAVDNPKGNTSVGLVPKDAETYSYEDTREGEADQKTGEFEIDDVPPGIYHVFASYHDEQNQFVGSTPVVVTNADVYSVRIVITRGAELHGRIVREGKIAPSMVIRIGVEPSDPQALSASHSTETRPDGSFSIAGLADGLYVVSASSDCDTCYLKSAVADGLDVLNAGLQVSSGSAPSPIDLVYSDRTGTIDGVVVRHDGLPAPGATVVLAADPLLLDRRRSYRSEPTDQYGHFVFRGVPPGSYRAFAWQDVDYWSYTDPDFLKPFEQKAKAFSISEGEKKTLQLTLLPAATEDH